MPSQSLRGSAGPSKTSTVDLYCTSCDTAVGTYENEWIRLTSSYIIPRVNGTRFGINVAEQYRTVDAKDAVALHGCALSEASCSKCSKPIGHLCRNAPSKPHLLGQYIYRMSRTHTKQHRTSVKVGFNFTFGANQPQQDRARSMFTAPPRPAQSATPHLYSARNEATRQSMGPPTSRPNNRISIDPCLPTPVSTPANNRENSVQGTDSTIFTPPNNRENSVQTPELSSEGRMNGRETDVILQRLEAQDNKLTSLSESINDWKIQNGRLLGALVRSNPQTLDQQDTSGALETLIDDFESMVNAAYEARSGNDELEVLRTENESMKAKLHTIALAMGTATGNTTPSSQPSTSPMTAYSTPSILGKRKRIEARNRHSLLQNQVSFADDDELNDQSGLYAINTPSQSSSTPPRHSERPPTTANAKAQAGSAMPEPARTAVQVLTPPDSSFHDQPGPASCSTERDASSDLELGRAGSTVPQVDDSVLELQVDSGSAQDHVPEIVKPLAVGTTTVENVAVENNGISSRIERPQRTCKAAPKIVRMTDNDGSGTVENVLEKQQSGGVWTSQNFPTRKETDAIQNIETRARAASALRRRTTSVLPNEADIEEDRRGTTEEPEQRRRTMSTLPENVNFDPRGRGGSSRPMMPQRITRANISHLENEQVTGNVLGYADGYEGTSEPRAEEAAGQDTSFMTMHGEEEREELFEQYQNGHHELQANGNNKENQWPVYAHSTDWSQSRQPSRRTRDPNRPKRVRRKPEEIERKYRCLFPGCNKAYGELPHLNTHIDDTNHGKRWSKSEYLTAIKGDYAAGDNDQVSRRGDSVMPTTLNQDAGRNIEISAEERTAEAAVAALKSNQARADGVDKIRQRDRMAKEAMEREELLELTNVA